MGITGTRFDKEYYLAFNRKSGFNSGTKEGGDQVLVTSRSSGQDIADSTLEAKMSDDDEFFIHRVGDESNIFIRVESINLFANPAYASVYVTKYDKICFSNDFCNDYDTCTIEKCNTDLSHIGLPKKSGTCVYEA